MYLNKCQKFLRYLWQKLLSTWLAIIELVSTKYFGNHLILHHFILSLTTNSDGKSQIANIYHAEVQDPITGSVRSMYREEQQMLADWENEDQEYEHVQTSVFEICMVHFLFLIYTFYLFFYLFLAVIQAGYGRRCLGATSFFFSPNIVHQRRW